MFKFKIRSKGHADGGFAFLFLFFLLHSFSACAAAVGNEAHNFGAACSSDKANGADWDTLFQCKNGTWQRAPYYFGASADACDASHAGVVQWTGTALQYCNGTAWGAISASAAAGSSGQVQYNNGGAFAGASSLIYTTTGSVGIGTMTPAYSLDVGGTIRASSEIISTNANQFRMVQGSYGSFFRNDGSNTYLLLTNAGDPYGGWNGLRPLTINNISGDVSMGSNLTVSGNVNVNGRLGLGYQQVSNACGTQTGFCDAQCPAGYVVLGGGCGFWFHYTYLQSYPRDSGAWRCGPDDSSAGVTTTAICARLQ